MVARDEGNVLGVIGIVHSYRTAAVPVAGLDGGELRTPSGVPLVAFSNSGLVHCAAAWVARKIIDDDAKAT